jgi:hypothetical protein
VGDPDVLAKLKQQVCTHRYHHCHHSHLHHHLIYIVS